MENTVIGGKSNVAQQDSKEGAAAVVAAAEKNKSEQDITSRLSLDLSALAKERSARKEQRFRAFSGSGRRVDGKRSSSSASSTGGGSGGNTKNNNNGSD